MILAELIDELVNEELSVKSKETHLEFLRYEGKPESITDIIREKFFSKRVKDISFNWDTDIIDVFI